jgi:hypothetical protein
MMRGYPIMVNIALMRGFMGVSRASSWIYRQPNPNETISRVASQNNYGIMFSLNRTKGPFSNDFLQKESVCRSLDPHARCLWRRGRSERNSSNQRRKQ